MSSLMRYSYISDTQLDMLVSQIPISTLKRTASELQISLSLIKISLKRSPADENRFNKLQVARRFLRHSDNTGELSTTPLRPWIIDRIPLSTVQVGDEAVLYIGDKEHIQLCLLGSRRSLVGTQSATTAGAQLQGTTQIIESLLSGSWNSPPLANNSGTPELHTNNALTLSVIDSALHLERGIARVLDFAAYYVAEKRFADGRLGILACPLYIGEAYDG